MSPVIVKQHGSHWGKLVFSIIYAFYYIALFPLVLKLIGDRESKEKAAEESRPETEQVKTAADKAE